MVLKPQSHVWLFASFEIGYRRIDPRIQIFLGALQFRLAKKHPNGRENDRKNDGYGDRCG
jgi:hypothetical protein